MMKIITLPAMLALGFFGITAFKKNTHTPPATQSINLSVVYDSLGIKSDPDTIVYLKTKPVNWNDFKGPVPEDFPAAANSAVGFMYRAGVASERGNISINIRITSFFVRPQSWVREKDKSAYILAHEQRHFDIARYGAELFRKKLLATSFTANRIGDLINKAYQEAWTEYRALQASYDDESEHSLNTPKQEAWNEKITQLLAQVP